MRYRIVCYRGGIPCGVLKKGTQKTLTQNISQARLFNSVDMCQGVIDTLMRYYPDCVFMYEEV